MSLSFLRRAVFPLLALLVLAAAPGNARAEESGAVILDRMAEAVVKKLDLGSKAAPRPLAGSLSATFTAPGFGGVPIDFSAKYKSRPPQDFQADITSSVGDYLLRVNSKTVTIVASGDKRFYTTDREDRARSKPKDTESEIQDIETGLKEWLREYRVTAVKEVANAPGGKAWQVDLQPLSKSGSDAVERMEFYVLQKSYLPWKVNGYSSAGKSLTAQFEYQGGEPVVLNADFHDSESAAKARFDLAYDKAGILRALDGRVDGGDEGVLELKAELRRKVQVSDADFSYKPAAGMRPASQEELTMLFMTRVMGLAIGAAMKSK